MQVGMDQSAAASAETSGWLFFLVTLALVTRMTDAITIALPAKM
jgi:hypothetical protein